MVEKREAHINDSLRLAKEAEEKMRNMAGEHSRMIQEAREEQAKILKAASDAKDNLIASAKEQARDEASRIIADARTQIAAEKESAIRDIRRQVAMISVSVAEKVIRKDFSEEKSRDEFLDRMVNEVSNIDFNKN